LKSVTRVSDSEFRDTVHDMNGYKNQNGERDDTRGTDSLLHDINLFDKPKKDYP